MSIKISTSSNYESYKPIRLYYGKWLNVSAVIHSIDHNEKDGGMCILPECIASIKSK